MTQDIKGRLENLHRQFAEGHEPPELLDAIAHITALEADLSFVRETVRLLYTREQPDCWKRREAAAVGLLAKLEKAYGYFPYAPDVPRTSQLWNEVRSALQAVEGGEEEQCSSGVSGAASVAARPDCSTAQRFAGECG